MSGLRVIATHSETDFKKVIERLTKDGDEIIAIVYNTKTSTHVDEQGLTAKACEQIASIFQAIARAKRAH